MSENEKTSLIKIFDLFRLGDNKSGVSLLYKNHYRKIFGIAFSIIKKEDDSKDVVHNVIYKLLNLEKSKFPASNELTWLYKVTKNEALQFLKSNEKYVPVSHPPFKGEEDSGIRNLIDMDSYYSIINNLNDEQRQIVTLKVIGGYTHKEISKMTGKPIGTVQWIYNASIKKLRNILAALGISFFIFAFSFARRLLLYIRAIFYGKTEFPGTTVNVPFDYRIVVNGLLAIISITIFCIIFKKSDKLPTKHNRKNI